MLSVSILILFMRQLKFFLLGEILPWFQGRSETGQRALGNRSILCRPDTLNLKKLLNDTIKFREAFRPYGCSVTQEKAHEYFEVNAISTALSCRLR